MMTLPPALGAGLLAVALGGMGCGPGASPGAGPAGPAAAGPDGPGPAGPAGTGPAAAPDEPDALRLAAIERAVEDTRDTRHACWALGAAADHRLAGTLVLRLTFGAGPTAAAEVLVDEPGDPRLTTCMVQLYQAYRWPAVFEPGMAVELPFSFQAPRWQHTVQAAHVEPAVLADGKLSARVLLHERNTGNGAASLSLLTLRDGMDVSLHRHTSAELLYVLEGEGVVYGLDGGPGRGRAVRAGHAIYLPAGVAHGFVHRGSAPVRLVQVYAPSGPERRFLGDPPVGTTPVAPAAGAARGRSAGPAPGPLVRSAPDIYELAGGQSSVAIYFDPASTGDRAAYLGVLTARPGMKIPLHAHADETEIVLVLSGTGTMTVAGDTLPIEPMTAVQIPPGVAHAFEVTGTEPVIAVQLYTPSGPEQRFKGLAGGTPAPESER